MEKGTEREIKVGLVTRAWPVAVGKVRRTLGCHFSAYSFELGMGASPFATEEEAVAFVLEPVEQYLKGEGR